MKRKPACAAVAAILWVALVTASPAYAACAPAQDALRCVGASGAAQVHSNAASALQAQTALLRGAAPTGQTAVQLSTTEEDDNHSRISKWATVFTVIIAILVAILLVALFWPS